MTWLPCTKVIATRCTASLHCATSAWAYDPHANCWQCPTQCPLPAPVRLRRKTQKSYTSSYFFLCANFLDLRNTHPWSVYSHVPYRVANIILIAIATMNMPAMMCHNCIGYLTDYDLRWSLYSAGVIGSAVTMECCRCSRLRYWLMRRRVRNDLYLLTVQLIHPLTAFMMVNW